jgi:hypothetical protein
VEKVTSPQGENVVLRLFLSSKFVCLSLFGSIALEGINNKQQKYYSFI